MRWRFEVAEATWTGGGTGWTSGVLDQAKALLDEIGEEVRAALGDAGPAGNGSGDPAPVPAVG